MKAEDKPKYVKEARELLDSIDIDTLVKDHNTLQEIRKISHLIAIFTNFSYNDGQELKKLLFEFQKWARHSTSVGTIRNRALDMIQFIDQKIKEMDIYVIESGGKLPLITTDNSRKVQRSKRKSKTRKSILGRDLKILWGRAGNRCSICNQELVHERTSSDPHVVVGIHSHIVADSPDGPRGNSNLPLEQRHFYDNLILVCMRHSKIIDEQLVTYTVEELKRLKEEHEAWVSDRLSAPEDIIGKQGTPVEQRDIPVLDLEGLRRSGGPTGQFILFNITNLSQTQRAIDCQWEVRGFNYSFRSPNSDRFSLQPNFSKEVTYQLDIEKPYQNEVKELSLVMEYKDINGNTYFTRRELKQVRMPFGAFYEFERGGIFYPAEQIVDIGIKNVSTPINNGGGYQSDFEVYYNRKPEFITIGVSNTLLATWGISEDIAAIKAALAELGSRVIRKMLIKKELKDYMFTTYDYPQEYQNGFRGYQLLRDSL